MNTSLGKFATALFFFTILATAVIVPHRVYSQSTTVTVAASNATVSEKASANYTCDGTDDQVEIQQAIDSLGVAGGTVTLNSGMFNLSSSIVVKQNIILQGQGAQTVLQASSNLSGQFIRVNGTDSRISSLIIDDGRTAGKGPQTNGIHIWSGNEIRLANVIIESVHIRRLQSGINGSDAISTNYTQNIGFQNNNIENVSGSGLIFYKTDNSVMTGNLINNLGKDGIILSESNGSKAINNSVSNVKYSGIVFGESNDASASGNLVSMTGNHGIISTLGGNRNTFTNNTVKQTGANGTGGFSHGIAIDGNEGKTPSSGHKIVNNYIENSYDAGIEVADSVDNVLISGNTVNGAGLGPHPNNTYGIYFGGGFTPCHLATISGNKITGAKNNGIEFGSNPGHELTTNIAIEGNEVYNNGGNGISAYYTKDFSIKNNTSYNNDQSQTESDGIQLNNSSNGVVESNHSYDNQTIKTQNFGLTFLGNVSNVVVKDNILAGNQFADTFISSDAVISNITATTTVAASNADNTFKSTAGYITDGIDDQAEIQQAIDSMFPLSGTVILSGGTFNVSSTIILKANTRLQGQGSSSILQAADKLNWRIILINGSNTKLTALAIHDGRPTPNPSDTVINAVHITGDNGKSIEKIIVDNIKITDIYSGGIEVADSLAKYIQLTNNYIENMGNGSGINLVGVDDSLIDHNTIIKTGGSLLWQAHGIRSSRGNRITISNNIVKKSGMGQDGKNFCRAITIDGDDNHFPNSGHKIINNYLEDSYQGAIELADGVSDTLIDGNTIKGAGLGSVPLDGWGIWIGGGFGPESHITISNNKISNAKQQGIFVWAFSPDPVTSDINITDNEISYSGQSGIWLAHTKNIAVKNNKVYNNHQRLIEGVKDGIRLTNSTDGEISGNRVYDDQINKTQDYGLGQGTINNITRSNNDFTGNRIGEIYSDQNLSTVNTPILCSVVNFVSIDANRDYIFDVTFSGHPVFASLWYSPVSSLSWKQIGQKCNAPSGNGGCKWSTNFAAPGPYYIICNAGNNQSSCEGNPQINGDNSCGASSHQYVNVKNPASTSPTSSPTPSFLPGDINRDHKVNIYDYVLLIQQFGKTNDCGNVADITGNCKVNIYDYAILIQNFGKTN